MTLLGPPLPSRMGFVWRIGSPSVSGVTTPLRTELGVLRIAAQRLAGERCTSPVETVRWLTAMQAQDLPGALASVALRTAVDSATAGTAIAGAAAVRAGMDAGEIVRSWPMRGTLHLVAAEDLRWMLPWGAARVATAAAARRTALGLDEPTLALTAELTTDALSAGRRLGRAGLISVWRAGGISTEGQRAAHLITAHALSGLICMGPTDGRSQAFVLSDEWLPPGVPRTPEEELGEWVLRYFRSHGPATLADFVRWTGLRVADGKMGLSVAGDELEQVDVDGVAHWMDPATPERLAACRAEARGVLLLPGFDELLLGYRDRSAVLDPAYADLLVPGSNGMFKATVVADGRVVGTWRRPTRAGAGPDVTPFSSLGRGVAAGVTRCWRTWPTV